VGSVCCVCCPLELLYSCEILHQHLLIISIFATPCNNQNGTLTHSTDKFFHFFVPDIMPHYHPHWSRRTEFLTDCAHALQHWRFLLYLHTHVIYGRNYRYLASQCVACSKRLTPTPSHHSLAIRMERYIKMGACIKAMGDVVILLCLRDVRDEGRREERKEE